MNDGFDFGMSHGDGGDSGAPAPASGDAGEHHGDATSSSLAMDAASYMLCDADINLFELMSPVAPRDSSRGFRHSVPNDDVNLQVEEL